MMWCWGQGEHWACPITKYFGKWADSLCKGCAGEEKNMIKIDGVELSEDTVRSALKKAGIELEPKVDWKTLDRGIVVEAKGWGTRGTISYRAFVFYDCDSKEKRLCLIPHNDEEVFIETVDGLADRFKERCKVVGRIKFVVDEK